MTIDEDFHAEQQYLEVLDLDGTVAEAYLQLAQIYRRRNDTQRLSQMPVQDILDLSHNDITDIETHVILKQIHPLQICNAVKRQVQKLNTFQLFYPRYRFKIVMPYG